MTLTEDDINVISDLITNAIAPITTRLELIESDLRNEIKIVKSRLQNSSCSLNEPLVKVPLQSGELPQSETPKTISALALPGEQGNSLTTENSWTNAKALALIREYEPDYIEDETEQMYSTLKRVKKLAKLLGVSAIQLSIAQNS